MWKTRIAEPEPSNWPPALAWRRQGRARKAVYANLVRPNADIGRETMPMRGEMVERLLSLMSLDRGGMYVEHGRAGLENLHKLVT